MSYRLKLTVTISLLIALSFGIGGTLMITSSFREILRQQTQTALSSFDHLQNTLGLLCALSDEPGTDTIGQVLDQMGHQGFGQWAALALRAQNHTLYQTGTPELLQYPLAAPEGNQCSYMTVSDAYGHGLLISSSLQSREEEMELLVRFDISGAYEIRQTQQRQYATIYIAVVCVGIVFSAILSYVLTRRLHRLAVTARKIAEGDLSRRSRIHSGDEIGQLSRDFDAMAETLQANIHSLEAEMDRQEQFMGAFAHELKTPMTSIIGFSDLLRQGDPDESTRMMAAQYIYSEGRRLERLSFKLLDLLLLKKDAVTMRTVDLPTLVAEIQHSLLPGMKKKGIRLVCKSDPGNALLEPDLVKSLLYNLVDNASKAVELEGMIALRATLIPGGCQFQVADTGRGMAAEELERITEAFYRVDKARSRSQGGAGLGLALCKQIAALHNGTIHFTSEPGKGTRVTVTLCTQEVPPV